MSIITLRRADISFLLDVVFVLVFPFLCFLWLVLLYAHVSCNRDRMKSFYSYSAKTASGELLDLGTLKNHVVLVVNVASKCGYTKQYKDLQEMYAKLEGKGFRILAFPCNQFGAQVRFKETALFSMTDVGT